MENLSILRTLKPTPEQAACRALTLEAPNSVSSADVERAIESYTDLLKFAAKIEDGEEHRSLIGGLRRVRHAIDCIKVSTPKPVPVRRVRKLRT